MKNTCYSRFETRPQQKNKVVWCVSIWKKSGVKWKLLPSAIWKDLFSPVFPLSNLLLLWQSAHCLMSTAENIWIYTQTHSLSINDSEHTDVALFAFGLCGWTLRNANHYHQNLCTIEDGFLFPVRLSENNSLLWLIY